MAIVSDERIEALSECFLAFVEAYTSTTGGALHKESDCTWFTTPIAFPVYNGVLDPRFAEGAEGRVEELQSLLKETGRPFSWMLHPGALPDSLPSLLEAANPAFTVELNGMATPIENVKPRPAPEGVEIRAAEDEATVAQYANLYTRLFGAPTEGWGEAVTRANLELFNSGNDPFHRYVAFEDGEPFAAGMTMLVGDNSILQTLYTVSEKRGRGVGHAILAKAFADERDRGAKQAVIWSGPDADKLYARAGFDYVAKAKVFIFE